MSVRWNLRFFPAVRMTIIFALRRRERKTAKQFFSLYTNNTKEMSF
jgi:hypothetical protein